MSVDNAAVRCGACKNAFSLGHGRGDAMEDTVAGWLSQTAEMPGIGDSESDQPSPPPRHFQPASHQAANPLSDKCPRLVQLQQRVALFEFPADSLRRDDFRCAIPRVCVHCQSRMHLRAHVVIYTTQLRDSISLEAEHKACELVIPQEQLGQAHGAELLARLPEVPNVPPPANLPMPYWVCDMCSGTGEISGQIQVDATTGRGICRLALRNLQIARGFFGNAGGTGSPDHARLQDFLQRIEEDRWDALPSVVQHRLEGWFRPYPQEKFLAYVPDRALVRTEDGMAGVIVSTHRLIYHRPPLHQEVRSHIGVVLKAQHDGDKEIVQMEAPEFKRRQMVVDRGGLVVLRRAISEGHFHATWA